MVEVFRKDLESSYTVENDWVTDPETGVREFRDLGPLLQKYKDGGMNLTQGGTADLTYKSILDDNNRLTGKLK